MRIVFSLLVGLALASAAGCGSSGDCEAAKAKLQTCGFSNVDQVTGCDGAAACRSSCIVAGSCEDNLAAARGEDNSVSACLSDC